MNLEYIFPTPIWSVDANLDLPKVEEFVYNLRERSDGRVISNAGGWQSEDFTEDQLPPELFKNFLKFLKGNLRMCFLEYGSQDIPELQNFWFNINKKGDYNKSHAHVGSCFSGCVYIKSDVNAGGINFERDSNEDYMIASKFGINTSRLAASMWRYNSIPNMMVIFPSWLRHSVEKSSSNDDRISMAFNVRAKNV